MKRYAVADEVPEKRSKWIKQGKEYPLMDDKGRFCIYDETGRKQLVHNFDRKPWRIVEREE